MVSSAELATDRFQSHQAAPGREWRAAAAYLWLGLPLMFLVRLALPLAGFAGVCLVGLAHLGVLSAVVTRLQRRSVVRDADLRVASLLLVIVFGRPFLPFPAVRIAWAITTIPFIAYVLPYVLGAAIARRGGDAPEDSLSPNTAI